MSSNNNHITPLRLTRDNYEEAFLMYVDEELTAEQKAAVEAFAAQHPDLQEELDDLLSTKLPLPQVTFMDKASLFADSMKDNAIDEDLLLYIDNELQGAAKTAVEEKINSNKEYSLQHQLLTKTKLDATEKIVYPYKEELYRKEERRIVYTHWWRVAAAAVVLLWAGTFDWNDTEDRSATARPVAVQTAPVTQPAVTDNNTIAAAPAANETTETIATTNAVTTQKESKTFAQPTAQNAVATETPVTTTIAAAQRITDVQTSNDYIPETRQQIFNDAVVTSAEPVRTISTDAHITTPVPVENDVASAGQERGGSLKGFLRKTTRFIERTTSINPVNADNELLIGALAIKVK